MEKEQDEFDAWWKKHVASGGGESNYSLARKAFQDGYEAGTWYDSDIIFHAPDAVG